MEVEQKISNFIKKGLERFASFQDEEHQTKPRKGSFSSSSSQESSPKHFQYQNLPQRTSFTYDSTSQFSESHADEPIYSASMDDNIKGNQVPFSQKGYRRSSSNIDEYYGRSQFRGDMMNNFETIDKVANIPEKEYSRSFSGPGALNHGKKEWVGSPQRHEEMGFRSSASGFQNYGKTNLIDSPKMEGGMVFQRPVSGLKIHGDGMSASPKNTSTRGQNEWIDSERSREHMERMHNLEMDKGAELSRAHKYYDTRGWGGGPQGRQEMEINQFPPGVHNYPQKEYIGFPKVQVQQDQRKMMHNLEANKVAGFSRSPMYPTKEEWNGSPRKPEVKLEGTMKWYGRSASITDDNYFDQKGLFIARSQGREVRGRADPDISDNIRYERYVPTNEFGQSQGSYREKIKYHQSQPELAGYGQQLKAPYMDAIEAAKLHGGVLIFDYSKYQQK